MHRLLTCSLLALAASACGDDPVSYSAPVGINVSVSSGDIQYGVVFDEKNINTESGNPYAAYIQAARDELGRDPGSIEIAHATLELLGTSNNVAALGEVFDGDVDISFVMNGSEAEYPATVVTIASDSGAGPIDMHAHHDTGAMSDEDWAEVVGGSFKVRASGPAATTFAAASADANMLATFEFVAYE